MALNFSLILLRTNTASTVPLLGINPYCILSISITSRKRLSKTFSYILKTCSNNFIPLQEFELRGSPFPLKTCTNKLNFHSHINLSLTRVSLNMFVKDFKALSPPPLSNCIETQDCPHVSPIFIQFIAHHTCSASIFLTVPSTLLASMLLSLH